MSFLDKGSWVGNALYVNMTQQKKQYLQLKTLLLSGDTYIKMNIATNVMRKILILF